MTDPAPDTPSDLAGLGYAEALAELERILRELEGSDVDVDRLSSHVERAAQLITVCRDRIGRARMQIDRVVADLDAAIDHTESGPGDAPPHDPA